MPAMSVIDLLERPVYGMGQVDRLLDLPHGTAERWIDGYVRKGKTYPPVVRVQSTGSDLVTWGEFVEARLLSEYRNAGVPMLRMRPAIERLREALDTLYPLAHARPFIHERELVLRAQETTALEARLHLVVVRNNQLVLTPPAEDFVTSVEFGAEDGVVERLRPVASIHEVVVDPLRQFGSPVVRSVPTEVIAEQVAAGERLETIADLYELRPEQVEAAIRYELTRPRLAAASG